MIIVRAGAAVACRVARPTRGEGLGRVARAREEAPVAWGVLGRMNCDLESILNRTDFCTGLFG